MEASPMSNSDTSKGFAGMPAKTAAWIARAHRCEKLPHVEDCLPYRNMAHMWAGLVGQWANRPWMTYYPWLAADEEPAVYTFGEFADLIERATAVLADEYRIGPGRTIVALAVSQPLTAALYFAAWRLGARLVPVSPMESDERIGQIVVHSGASLLLMHTSCRNDHEPLDRILEAAGQGDLQRALVLDGASRDSALVAGWDDFSAALEAVTLSAVPSEMLDLSWDSEALVVYPTGVTGLCRGVVLTQKQLFSAAYGISQWHEIDQRSVIMSGPPLHRTSEIVLALVTSAFVGAQVVVNQRLGAEGYWSKLARHDVGVASVGPRFLQALLEAQEEFNPQTIPNLRHFISRSQPLTVEAAGEFQDRFGLKIVHGYGLNETACYSCFLPTTLDWYDHMKWICEHEVPSVGMPIVVNDVDIHDDRGRSLGYGQRGEIVARGHNIMAGYLHDPQANAAAFENGWFHSGYQGFKLRSDDGQDYFFVAGRIP
jgi:long-chain acyl-CoA synthetase